MAKKRGRPRRVGPPPPRKDKHTMNYRDEDGKRHQLRLKRDFEPGFLDSLDNTTPGVAKVRARYGLLLNHVAAGHNVMKQILCQRLALLWLEIETLEVQALKDGERLPPRWSHLLNLVTGMAKTLGLEEAQGEVVDVHTTLSRILEQDE